MEAGEITKSFLFLSNATYGFVYLYAFYTIEIDIIYIYIYDA